jgi:phosphatidate cytidylyltransferase
MAFNKEVFTTRAITAIFFVAVMLIGLLWNEVSFFALVMLIHAGCWVEYEKIIAGFRRPLLYTIFGIVYISVSWALFLDLQVSFPFYPLGPTSTPAIHWFPIFTIACMWINDTMAYLVGSFIGKTPFSKISPKKTWEGTLGGVLLTVLVLGWTASNFFDQLMPAGLSTAVPSMHWYILALLAAIAGTAGDLLESKFKRRAGVKDSGTILPGHGGYLDRFDSLLVATPMVWIYLRVVVF